MPMFVDRNEKIGVSDEKGNTVFVRPKMDVGTSGRVTDAIASISRLGSQDDGTEISLNLGSQNAVLLVHNILDWQGPDFEDGRGRKVPCTRDNILRLDPDEPLVGLVLAEINRLNVRPVSPDPNSPTASGSTSAGD